MRATVAGWLWGVLVLLTACQSGARTDQPPDIRWGEDPCDECHMIISEQRFAAGYHTAEGTTFRFDDIGCMLQHLRQRSDSVSSIWVVDYTTGKWLPATQALFVHSREIITPMGHGIVAVSSPAEADALTRRYQGKRLLWEEVKNKIGE